MKEEIPKDFIEYLKELLGAEADELIEALNDSPVVSIRLNKRKSIEGSHTFNAAEFDESSPVRWCSTGFYLPKRPDFILDPLLHAGAYYVQDASSMIYEPLTAKIVEVLSQNRTNVHQSLFLRVLDLCAAPGGKTTAIINALPDGCEITANEYSPKRVSALRENIDRWGYPGVTVTNKATDFFASQGETYDIVAVDAPCSGEGMMRKDDMARHQWSPALVNQCSALQKEILINAEKSLKPGGFLVYSTCTFNRVENENNAEFIRDNLGLKPFDPSFPSEWGIPRGIDTDLPVYRFMPHKTRGEGLFLAVFQKPGNWEPSYPKAIRETKPDSSEPKVEVDKDTALKYLRRESFVLPSSAPLGMITICYKGLALGPAKNIGKRVNNLYPKNRRILKQ